ncbi:hypothetical protein T265_12295 [Opisthorchis viverrini]|uniref:Uncharacterized protein n=1 Tax=Opisthorchis viverrini TaxID=6198 RepID=A0A074YYT8_OPIVI|nr:hypothetical protein T265_12295 [Opisthorchis viverrini]KER18362.1 hypothetical protein T265_12295 [Opisthorchis viverrini]
MEGYSLEKDFRSVALGEGIIQDMQLSLTGVQQIMVKIILFDGTLHDTKKLHVGKPELNCVRRTFCVKQLRDDIPNTMV